MEPSSPDFIKCGKVNGVYYRRPWGSEDPFYSEGSYTLIGTQLYMMVEDLGYTSVFEGTIDPVTKEISAFEMFFDLPESDVTYVGKINDEYNEIQAEFTVVGKKDTITFTFTEADEIVKSRFNKNGLVDGEYTDEKGVSHSIVGVVNLYQGKITLTVPDSDEKWYGTVNLINRRVLIVKEDGKAHFNPVLKGFINEELNEILGDKIQLKFLLQED